MFAMVCACADAKAGNPRKINPTNGIPKALLHSLVSSATLAAGNLGFLTFLSLSITIHLKQLTGTHVLLLAPAMQS